MDLTIDSLENARIGRVFRSRKNRVFRVIVGGKTLVAKVYPAGSDDKTLHEYSVLEGCVKLGVRVPLPVGRSGQYILMESIEGMTAAEAIDASQKEAEPTLIEVVNWLCGFHRAHDLRLCRGDSVLHNFLMSPTGVVGIDFEEAHEGDPIEDLGEVVASFLGMHPFFSEDKIAVARRIVAEYLTGMSLDMGVDVPGAVSSALRHYARFRKDGALLNSWADKIAREGLRSGEE